MNTVRAMMITAAVSAAVAATSPVPAAPAGTTLTGPATEAYSGSSNALSITNSGGNRGISVSNSASSNASSALYGETYGSGAGLTGFNYGTSGPGGKFQILSANSTQPAVFTTTAGFGPAVLATATNNSNGYPVIYAQNTGDGGQGVGIRGDGSKVGVGAYAQSIGLAGISTSDYFGIPGEGVYGEAMTNGVGVYAKSYNGYAVYAISYSGSAFGAICNTSGDKAAFFDGSVAATAFEASSDRNAKRDFSPVNTGDVLERINQLPISSWDFKKDRKQRRHIGPMAQDFYAAFHLNGDDDKHINVGDLAGVSLAAIQELQKGVAANDARVAKGDREIADLQAQLASFSARVALIENETPNR
jgi:hypothetical protein